MRRLITRFILATLILLTSASAFAQTYTLSPPPFLLAQNNSGQIINNACIWTYAAGTTTAATTYSDTSGTPNLNPIRSDPAGRFTAYLVTGNNYKFTYETACVPPAHGTVLRTQDNIAAVPASAASVDVIGGAGEPLSAGQCAYLSDGSGAKTAGQWFKCDSTNTYSSLTPEIGLVPTAIASGASGTIRIAGSVTGLSSLSVGQPYYVSTSGAITATAPTNARIIGQADSATSLVVSGNPAVRYLVPPLLSPLTTGCGIRLTLTAGTPVTSADVTAAPTIFATPYSAGGWGAGVCAFFDGTATWTTLTFTETSIPLGTLTGSLPYDVFCYNNSGTMACELLAWTNGTARATALVLQNGVLVKTGATTRRYIGTFYTTSTTTTEDSAAKRLLWNYYNRATRQVRVVDTTDSWTYTLVAYEQARASTANQVALIQGVAEEAISLAVAATASNSGSGVGVTFAVGIGVNSTTVNSAVNLLAYSAAAGGVEQLHADYQGIPAVGFSFYAWLEQSAASGTTTWLGDNGGTVSQSGITGLWKS